MKKEMKMKIPLLLILSWFCQAVMATSNESELVPADVAKWSFDGGVFEPRLGESPDNQANWNQVLIKSTQGEVSILNSKQSVGPARQIKTVTTIQVDRTAPLIEDQWQGALVQPNGVVIGPASEVSIMVNEAQISEIWVDGEIQPVSGMSQNIRFHQTAETLRVVAEDEFNNTSQSEWVLIADFAAPEYDWRLLEPAIQANGQWFAGAQAELRLNATDNMAMGTVELNNQTVEWTDKTLQVKMGDELQVSDALGNRAGEKLVWEVDSTIPIVRITVNGVSQEGKKNFVVKANELIDLTTLDEGVGIQMQKYKGKSRKWQPLPKKFRFTSKGNYRIQVYSEDRVGNTLETTLQFKVKR